MDAAAVELRDATKRFGAAVALDAMNLRAHAGEFLTLLGPSGCGKTTCLRLISGLEQPDSGAVWLDGQDVTALPPYRREVNQVFQSYALFPHLNVRENIEFGLRMQRRTVAEIKRRVAGVVELVALGELTNRRPAELSGGQRQRVALARALVCEPKVLLLDEPLSALDARLRAQVRTELRALQRRLGLTFIFVTHDQEEALTLSDRVAVLNQGRLEQIGTVEEVYHRPASRFVAGFIGEANLLEAEVISSQGAYCQCRVGDLSLEVPVDRLPKQPVGLGDALTLLIRPEQIKLLTVFPSSDGRNVFPARVTDRVFQGATLSFTLISEAADGQAGSCTLRAFAVEDDRGLAVDARLWVQIPPHSINCLSS